MGAARNKVIAGASGVAVVAGIIAVLGATASSSAVHPVAQQLHTQPAAVSSSPLVADTMAPVKSACTSCGTNAPKHTAPASPQAPKHTAPASPQAPKHTAPASPQAPELTASQEQAVVSAESYLNLGTGFSEQGLLGQLTSSYGSGFTQADAEFAISYLKPDWDAQAVIAAKNYLNLGTGFSADSLREQLMSSYGSQFTYDQAEYAVEQVGLS